MKTPKYVAALELLSRAIELYLRGDSYYSALHLAGAAEEILAVYVRDLPEQSASGIGSSSDQLKKAFVALPAPMLSEKDKKARGQWFHHRTFEAKNAVKHKRGVKDHALDFSAQQEAADLIELAISTYWQLYSCSEKIPHLPYIEAFDEKRRIENTQDKV